MTYHHKLLSGISESTGVPVEHTSVSMSANVVTGHAVVYRHTGLKARPASCEESEKNQW